LIVFLAQYEKYLQSKKIYTMRQKYKRLKMFAISRQSLSISTRNKTHLHIIHMYM